LTVSEQEVEALLRTSARIFDQRIAVTDDLHGRILENVEGRRYRAVPLGLRRRLAVAIGVGLAVLVAINLGAVYYFPRYGQALADAPGLGVLSRPVLRATGLTGANVTQVDSVAVSSGHKLHLVAGYADPLRTLLFVEVDDEKLVPASKTSHTYFIDGFLTVQFGHVYHQLYGTREWLRPAVRAAPAVPYS